MFTAHDDVAPVTMADGVTRATLAVGAGMLLAEIHLAAGSAVATHSHPHEQIGHVVSGEIVMEIGQERRRLRAGDAYCVPGGVPHMAEAVVDAVVVDVFHPVREEYR